MKEKLIIKNFGPIKDVELDLGRFTVLIGEQATGKSTVAKLLAVCRYFSYIVNDQELAPWEEGNFFEGLKSWGLRELIKENSYIFYECKDYSLEVKVKVTKEFNDEIKEVEYCRGITKLKAVSPEFISLLSEMERIRPKLNERLSTGVGWIIPTSFFQNDVAAVMDNPFYLPTERGLQSIFSLGKNSIPNIGDSLFNQFAKLDQIVKVYKNETDIEPLSIVYKNEAGRGYTKKYNETEFYSLEHGASGYQSTVPIVLVTKYYSEKRRKSKTFVVEEPELNLFPSSQQKLIDYLVDRIVNYRNSILITTHSPYTLTSLNNLLYAYKLGQLHSEETEKIIKKRYWLNHDNVSVYMMLPDGSCEDIFDREEGLIKAEKIDGVSGILNKEFEALLNIEYAGK